jgi:hypothetical protein
VLRLSFRAESHHPRIPKKRLIERRNIGVVDIRIALRVNPFRIALG